MRKGILLVVFLISAFALGNFAVGLVGAQEPPVPTGAAVNTTAILEDDVPVSVSLDPERTLKEVGLIGGVDPAGDVRILHVAKAGKVYATLDDEELAKISKAVAENFGLQVNQYGRAYAILDAGTLAAIKEAVHGEMRAQFSNHPDLHIECKGSCSGASEWRRLPDGSNVVTLAIVDHSRWICENTRTGERREVAIPCDEID